MTTTARQVASHYESLSHQDRAGTFAMWVFISSDVLFFAVLFMLFAAYRTEYPAGFAAASEHSKILIGTANTFILLTSSLFVAISTAAIRQNRIRLVMSMQALTIVFACAFLGLKGLEYFEHFQEGIFPGHWSRFAVAPDHGSSLFFTLYFVITGLHALHVLIGIGLFAWLLRRTWRGVYSADAFLGISVVGLYWHFVDIVWVFLWPLFYLIH